VPASPRRGELYWVDWNPARGSEQAGRRPGLIVQTDAANLNPNYPNTIVATVSTSGRQVPTHVHLAPSSENGLTEPSFVKCEQIMTVSKDRLVGRIGHISSEEGKAVDDSIKRALSLT